MTGSVGGWPACDRCEVLEKGGERSREIGGEGDGRDGRRLVEAPEAGCSRTPRQPYLIPSSPPHLIAPPPNPPATQSPPQPLPARWWVPVATGGAGGKRRCRWRAAGARLSPTCHNLHGGGRPAGGRCTPLPPPAPPPPLPRTCLAPPRSGRLQEVAGEPPLALPPQHARWRAAGGVREAARLSHPALALPPPRNLYLHGGGRPAGGRCSPLPPLTLPPCSGGGGRRAASAVTSGRCRRR